MPGLCRFLLATSICVGGSLRAETLFRDVSEAALPLAATDRRSMDVEMGDFDHDGDLDILVAMEFSRNLLLLNRGDGTFSDASDRLPPPVHDSEDIALSDFDGDGDLDAVVVAEDDKTDLYYVNDGQAHFSLGALPVAEITNGVARGDIDGDGDEDLITANAGANAVWINDAGEFELSAAALPAKEWVSQDVQTGDLDGDGDTDIVEANEGRNRVLLNDGSGGFTEHVGALPDSEARESRQAALGDIDGDGDLDLVFGNVSFGYARRQARAGIEIGHANRLFINQGNATFRESPHLPKDEIQSAHIDFVDLDRDGDLDILATSIVELREPGTGRVHAYLNDGTGIFTDKTSDLFPDSMRGNGFDVAVGDVNGDGKPDLYLANRIGLDRLILAD